jgi:integrase
MQEGFPFLRKKNKEIRSREFLYENEIKSVMKAAIETGNSLRNQALVLISYRRALRPGEALNLKWHDVSFENRKMTIHRIKNGRSGDHLIHDLEIRILKKLQKEKNKKGCVSPYIFVSNKGGPLTVSGYEKLCEKLGKMAGLPFKLHPHMFRHSWGEKARSEKTNILDMMAHFGHRDVKSTLFYVTQTGNSELNLFRD